MKILWHSNAPYVPTGYGQQTATFVPRLKEAGHDIAVSAFYGLGGGRIGWDGITIYPHFAEPYGNDVILAHASNHFGGNALDGVIITLVDAWVLDPKVLKLGNVACWVPIDHEPPPPAVLKALRDSECVPIAMTELAQKALQGEGIDALYVPHGIDTSVFRPVDRAESRAKLGLPEDAFIVGMVAANKNRPSRKAFPEAIQAFARFREKHKDAILYLHTEMNGILHGANIPAILHACEIPDHAVRVTDPYDGCVVGHSPGYLQAAYNSMDVLLNPAFGEGFGVPIVEAQACGTPVIVTKTTAMREVGQVGWQVGGQQIWTDQHSWMTVPNIGEITWALEEAYSNAGAQRERAAEFGARYDADLVMAEHWGPALQHLEERYLPQEPSKLQVVGKAA